MTYTISPFLPQTRKLSLSLSLFLSLFLTHNSSLSLPLYLPHKYSLSIYVSLSFSLIMQGHGRSSGEKRYFQKFDHLVDDLIEFTEAKKLKYSGVNTFLWGHSMGGAMSILAAIRAPHLYKAVVLSSPLVKLADEKLNIINLTLAPLLGIYFTERKRERERHVGVCVLCSNSLSLSLSLTHSFSQKERERETCRCVCVM